MEKPPAEVISVERVLPCSREYVIERILAGSFGLPALKNFLRGCNDRNSFFISRLCVKIFGVSNC